LIYFPLFHLALAAFFRSKESFISLPLRLFNPPNLPEATVVAFYYQALLLGLFFAGSNINNRFIALIKMR
jgi:hypothetical protein